MRSIVSPKCRQSGLEQASELDQALKVEGKAVSFSVPVASVADISVRLFLPIAFFILSVGLREKRSQYTCEIPDEFCCHNIEWAIQFF